MEKKKKRELLKKAVAILMSFAMVAGMFMGTGMDVRASGAVEYNALPGGKHLENGTEVTNNMHAMSVCYCESQEIIEEWASNGAGTRQPDTVIWSFTSASVKIGVGNGLTGEWENRDWHTYAHNDWLNITGIDTYALYLYPCDCPDPSPSTGGAER